MRCIHWIPAAIASRPRPLATPLRVIHDRVEPSSRRLSDVIHAKKNQIEPQRANTARLTKCGEFTAKFLYYEIKWALLAGRMKAEADLGWLETVETAKVASTRPIMPRVLPSHIVQALPRPTHRMSRGGAASWRGPRVVRPRLGLAHAAGAVSARRPFEPPPTGFDDIFDLSLQARDNQVVERKIELARIR